MYLLFNCSALVSLHFYLQMLLVIDLFQYKESQWTFSASREIQRRVIHASIIRICPSRPPYGACYTKIPLMLMAYFPKYITFFELAQNPKFLEI